MHNFAPIARRSPPILQAIKLTTMNIQTNIITIDIKIIIN